MNTMPNPTLLERVEAASGPDREIDALVWLALEPDCVNSRQFWLWRSARPKGEQDRALSDVRLAFARRHAPEITASLDAALALVERVLPGWAPNVGKNVHHGHWHAEVQKADEENGNLHFGATAASGALALVAALLKASPEQSE